MKETVDVSESAATRTPGDMMVLYTDGITETSADRLADRLEGGDGAPRQALPAA
jgi:serine phosphatase RsbU (regulator of sigma subunit)